MPSHSCSCSDWDLGSVWLFGRAPETLSPKVGLGLPRSRSFQSSVVSSDHVLHHILSNEGTAHLAWRGQVQLWYKGTTNYHIKTTIFFKHQWTFIDTPSHSGQLHALNIPWTLFLYTLQMQITCTWNNNCYNHQHILHTSHIPRKQWVLPHLQLGAPFVDENMIVMSDVFTDQTNQLVN